MNRIARITLGIALIAACAPLLAAQPAVSLTAVSPIMKPGATQTITVSTPAVAGLTSIQFGISLSNATAGSLAANAGIANKSSQCASQPLAVVCILYGVNTATIPAGILATIPITASASGATSFTVTATALGSDKSGNAITFANASLVIPIQSPYDLNGDGVVNSSDTVLEIGAALQAYAAQLAATLSGSSAAAAPCPQDVNGDGACNIQDVQLIRNQYP
jgi:hypothetical protein